MPHVSRREIRERLAREWGTDHLVSCELIVEEPDGRELIRAGGVWDDSAQCYVAPPPGFDHQPERIRLKVSQVPAARGIARWFGQVRRGEKNRSVVFIFGGKPGSGKTFLLMIFHSLVALEWPGDVQFVSNLNLDNRGECLTHLAVIARPEWYRESEDPKNPCLDWANGAIIKWISARNAKKLRQRGLNIRAVGVNEGQDQSEELYAVAQSAPRTYGGALAITMNPPTTEGGNWTARLWFGIEAGDVAGEIYQMDSADNDAVDHDFIDAAGKAIRVAAPRLAGAHVDGLIVAAGDAVYAKFDGRPANTAAPELGGHVGEPPPVPEVGRALWEDVTRKETAALMGSERGADVVIGCDFQKHPGCIGAASKLYRIPDGRLVLYVERVISVEGLEDDFSQALYDAGYTANGYRSDGTEGPLALLIGDATGDRQNAPHIRWKPSSYHAMQSNGWAIKPPDVHMKNRTPWNPSVLASIDQMHVLLERREILLGPRCRQATPGFPSLVDSFRNALKSYSGKLRPHDVFQHGPDGVRYLAWRFLPRHKPVALPRDPQLAADLRSIRLSDR